MTDWNSIIREHRELVWQTAFRLVGNEADAHDCLQEVFLEAVKVNRREPVRHWPSILRHLTTVRAMDLLRVRYRSRWRTHPLDNPDESIGRGAGPELDAEANELAERLRCSLANLPPAQAEAFCLCRIEGLSYREAAERLETDANQIGVLLHRARERLERDLAPERIDTPNATSELK